LDCLIQLFTSIYRLPNTRFCQSFVGVGWNSCCQAAV
jgi:hypothetical protein